MSKIRFFFIKASAKLKRDWVIEPLKSQQTFGYCCIHNLSLDSFWQNIWLVCPKVLEDVSTQYLQENIASRSFHWIRFSWAY